MTKNRILNAGWCEITFLWTYTFATISDLMTSHQGIFFRILAVSQNPVGGTLRDGKGTLDDLKRAP